MSKREFETLTIKYTAPKEHLEAIREAAKGFSNLETFFHICVVKYLEEYWFPRRIAIPKKLFRMLVEKAKEQGVTVDELATEIVLQNIKKNP